MPDSSTTPAAGNGPETTPSAPAAPAAPAAVDPAVEQRAAEAEQAAQQATAEQLADLDPTDAKFGERLDAVIAAAVEANPLLRTTPAGPPRGGADFSGGPAATVTPEQFAAMSYGQRVELHQSDPDLYRQLSAANE